MTDRYQYLDTTPASVGEIFQLIRSGSATSRAAIAKRTGLSPSTVGLRVEALQNLGLVGEDGVQQFQGGRRARNLQIVSSAGYVVAMESGVRHLNLAIADLSGIVLSSARLDSVGGLEPRAAVETMWDHIEEMFTTAGLQFTHLRGIAIGIPAPVEYPSGRIVLPSLMPSWHDAILPDLFQPHTQVPVLVENDANIVALSETSTDDATSPDYLLAVLLGRRVGSGVIADGKLLRGFNGAAGEFGHTLVQAEPAIACICGLGSCLESVASGDAILARLNNLGHRIENLPDIITLSRSSDPQVISVLREAGTHIGAALASTVNFFNPRRVVLGGILSSSAPLVAAIRAELFQRCLPIAAQDLDVSAANDPETAWSRGAIRLLLDEVLAPARIEHFAKAAADGATQTA